MSDFYSKQILRSTYDYVCPLELAHMGFHIKRLNIILRGFPSKPPCALTSCVMLLCACVDQRWGVGEGPCHIHI